MGILNSVYPMLRREKVFCSIQDLFKLFNLKPVEQKKIKIHTGLSNPWVQTYKRRA